MANATTVSIEDMDLSNFDDALQQLRNSIKHLSQLNQERISRHADLLIAELQNAETDKEEAVRQFLSNSKPLVTPESSVKKALVIFAVAAVATVLAGFIGFGIGFAAAVWAGPTVFISAVAAASAAALSVIGIAVSVGLLGGYAASRFFNAPETAAEDLDKFAHTAVSAACLMLHKNWHEILQYGRWAPSPHNMQSWLFQIESDDTVTLMYDPKRLLPGTNPTGSFMYVGFGVLHEMLSIAAAPLVLEVEASYLDVTLDSTLEGPQPLATLKLVPRKQKETLERDLIIERQTSRLPYDGRTIPPEVHQELAQIAEQFGHKYEYSDEQAQVDWVVRLNAETMFFDMSQAEARNEVASWMRFSQQSAEQRKDGLAAEAMGAPGPLMWLFANANWLFRLPGLYHLVRYSYEQGMQGTSTVGWLSGPFETPEENERAGRMMARLWLTMTKHQVYLHPFGSVITNPQAHAMMDEHFQNEDRQDDLWMLMRLGYSDKPYQAKRMPLQNMIVSPGGFFKPAEPGDSAPDESLAQQESCQV